MQNHDDDPENELESLSQEENYMAVLERLEKATATIVSIKAAASTNAPLQSSMEIGSNLTDAQKDLATQLLVKQKDDALKALEDARKEIARLNAHVEMRNDELGSLRQSVARELLSIQLGGSDEIRKVVRARKDYEESEVVRLKKEIARRDEALESQAMENNLLVKKLRYSNEQIKRKSDKAEGEIVYLADSLKTAEATLLDKTKVLVGKEGIIDRQMIQLDEQHKEIQDNNTVMNDLKAQVVSLSSKLAQEIEARQAAEEGPQEDQAFWGTMVESLHKEKSEAETRLMTLKGEHEVLQQKHTKLVEKLDDLLEKNAFHQQPSVPQTEAEETAASPSDSGGGRRRRRPGSRSAINDSDEDGGNMSPSSPPGKGRPSFVRGSRGGRMTMIKGGARGPKGTVLQSEADSEGREGSGSSVEEALRKQLTEMKEKSARMLDTNTALMESKKSADLQAKTLASELERTQKKLREVQEYANDMGDMAAREGFQRRATQLELNSALDKVRSLHEERKAIGLGKELVHERYDEGDKDDNEDGDKDKKQQHEQEQQEKEKGLKESTVSEQAAVSSVGQKVQCEVEAASQSQPEPTAITESASLPKEGHNKPLQPSMDTVDKEAEQEGSHIHSAPAEAISITENRELQRQVHGGKEVELVDGDTQAARDASDTGEAVSFKVTDRRGVLAKGADTYLQAQWLKRNSKGVQTDVDQLELLGEGYTDSGAVVTALSVAEVPPPVNSFYAVEFGVQTEPPPPVADMDTNTDLTGDVAPVVPDPNADEVEAPASASATTSATAAAGGGGGRGGSGHDSSITARVPAEVVLVTEPAKPIGVSKSTQMAPETCSRGTVFNALLAKKSGRSRVRLERHDAATQASNENMPPEGCLRKTYRNMRSVAMRYAPQTDLPQQPWMLSLFGGGAGDADGKNKTLAVQTGSEVPKRVEASVHTRPTPQQLERRFKRALAFVEEATRVRHRLQIDLHRRTKFETVNSRAVLGVTDVVLVALHNILSPWGRTLDEEFPELLDSLHITTPTVAMDFVSHEWTHNLVDEPEELDPLEAAIFAQEEEGGNVDAASTFVTQYLSEPLSASMTSHVSGAATGTTVAAARRAVAHSSPVVRKHKTMPANVDRILDETEARLALAKTTAVVAPDHTLTLTAPLGGEEDGKMIGIELNMSDSLHTTSRDEGPPNTHMPPMTSPAAVALHAGHTVHLSSPGRLSMLDAGGSLVVDSGGSGSVAAEAEEAEAMDVCEMGIKSPDMLGVEAARLESRLVPAFREHAVPLRQLYSQPAPSWAKANSTPVPEPPLRHGRPSAVRGLAYTGGHEWASPGILGTAMESTVKDANAVGALAGAASPAVRMYTQAEKDVTQLLVASGAVVANVVAPGMPLPPNIAKRMGLSNMMKKEKESAQQHSESRAAHVQSPLRWRPARKGAVPEPITNAFMFE